MTPTTQQKLEAITARICELLPVEKSPNHCKHGHKKGEIIRMRSEGASLRQISEILKVPKGTVAHHLKYHRHISLEDVLVAVKCNDQKMDLLGLTRVEWQSNDNGDVFAQTVEPDKSKCWHLGKPLSEQHPLTIDWLYSLLPSSK